MSNVKGILALIFGIIGCFFFGIVFGIIAIILGVMGRKSDDTPMIATIGMILGIIAVVCWILSVVLLISLLAMPGL